MPVDRFRCLSSPGSILGAGAMLLLLACAHGIGSDRDNTLPTPAGSTYAWGGSSGDSLPGEIDLASNDSPLAGRVERAIDRQMQSRGWRLVDPAQADFLVHYAAGVSTQTRPVFAYPSSSWLPPGQFVCAAARCTYQRQFSMGHSGPSDPSVKEVSYRQSTLMIELEEAGSGHLTWRGLWKHEATGRQPTEERVNQVVAQTMQDLPSVK